MKKQLIFVLLWLCILLLGACKATPTTYTVESYGTTFVVDTEAKTITDQENTYSYLFGGNKNNYTIVITYPDSTTYEASSDGSSSHSKNYGVRDYVSGDRLCAILVETAIPSGPSAGGILFAFLLIPFGLFSVCKPQTLWKFQHGWIYKNAEPSDTYLTVTRVIGAVAVLIGIIALFV